MKKKEFTILNYLLKNSSSIHHNFKKMKNRLKIRKNN